MKLAMTALVALLLVAGDGAALAQPNPRIPGRDTPQQTQDKDRDRDRDRDDRRGQKPTPRWSPGERLPNDYGKAETNWRARNLTQPPAGYHWVCDQRRNCFLVRTKTGVIRTTNWYDERDDRWRQRYRQRYTYNDDLYYRECRERPDPAGILLGGVIGGLLGRAAGDGDDAGTVFAGIIIGSAIGGALARDLDCDDRGYAYRAYYQALNDGRPGRSFAWNNPRNKHRGEFRVRGYSNDAGGFRCATYTHTAWLPGRKTASGRACRQPDGAWVFLNN